MGFPRKESVKNSVRNAGDPGSIPGLEGYLGGGNGNLLQYSGLGNPMDRRAWRATVPGLAKSWTPLSRHARLYTRAGNVTLALK